MTASPAIDPAQLLYLDPMGGHRLHYRDLLQWGGEEGYHHFPLKRPKDAADALRALVGAFVFDQPITLFDSDFSDAECAALGARPGDLERTIRFPERNFASAEELLHEARRARGFRLTLFTSGSTGMPKQVTHSFETLARGLRQDPRHRGDVWALAYNATHMAGIQVILQAVFNGNPLIDLFACAGPRAANLLVEHRVTHLSATPTFFRLLLPLEPPVRSVRSLTLGGERADETLIARLRQAFPMARLRNIYASTEAGPLLVAEGEVFSVPPELAHKLRIHDNRLQAHQSLLGHFAGAPAEADWYDTGDRVEVLGQSPLRFRFLAREREAINVGGLKVDPREVEAVLLDYPEIHAARVSAAPNALLGAVLQAEVAANSERLDEPALRQYLATRLQPHKIPRLITFHQQLPPARTGKS